MKKTNCIEREKRIEIANEEIKRIANCKSNFLANSDCGFSYFYMHHTNRLYFKYFGIEDINKKSFCMSKAYQRAKISEANLSEKEHSAILALSVYIKYENQKKPSFSFNQQ